MARRGVVCYQVVFVEAEDTDIVLTVHNNKFFAAELKVFNRCGSRGRQGDTDSLLAKDVDFTRAEAGFIGTDGEEGLDGVIGHDGDLGVDSIAGKL